MTVYLLKVESFTRGFFVLGANKDFRMTPAGSQVISYPGDMGTNRVAASKPWHELVNSFPLHNDSRRVEKY